MSMLFNRVVRRFAQTVKIPLPEVETFKFDPGLIPTEVEVTKDEVMQLWHDMVTIRRAEMATDAMYKNREIRGFCHLAIGQEGTNVGVESGLKKQDHLITAYRCHGNAIMRGMSVKEIIAEMASKVIGSSKGKGGSMHIFSKEKHFWGGNAIVGAHVPVGTGISFSIRYKDLKDECVVAMFGDGASNQGQVFEAMNIAGLHNCPIIYCLENNGYAYATAQERHSHQPCFYKRGFDKIPGIRGNGFNVLAAREIVKAARKYCVENGPIITELMTYRYQGHSMADTGAGYRTKEEVDRIKRESDCIEMAKGWILDHSLATEAELKEKEKAIRSEINKIVEEVRAAPETDLDELFTDIYSKPMGFIRAVEYPNSHDYGIPQ